MSAYRGRTGPNVSEFLNNLNTLGYEPERFASNDLNLTDDLAMFTNTDFTDFDIPPLSENDGLNFDLEASSSTQPTYYSQYNTPIQPLPPATGFPVHSTQYATTVTSPASVQNTSSLHRQAETVPSPAVSADEQSRVAAEEDKRRRNTAASARFRVKKKQREQNLEKTNKELNERYAKIEAKYTNLEMENKLLKKLITEMKGSQSKEEIAQAYQKFRKESEERELEVEQKERVGTS